MIPRSIGKYDVMDALGVGGMGTVYRAFDTTLERTVAIKILQLDRGHDITPQELSARFRNEARAVARLNHPAIVTIFDYDDQDPVGAYIAMEYINGCALDEYVKLRPELHLEDAISAMQQVLAGLAYAHRQGVIHRDIKPSNLLVTREGLVKITDFGIAKIGPRSQTQSGLIVGTPQYMAPEQYMGGVVDHRCDIHAAGAVLYELLTGSPPFQGSAAEVMYKVCHEVPRPVSQVNPLLPQAFDPVVAKALDKIAANRYASAGEFQEALRASWDLISPRPPSSTLSDRARLVATVISRQPVVAKAAPGSGLPAAAGSTPVSGSPPGGASSPIAGSPRLATSGSRLPAASGSSLLADSNSQRSPLPASPPAAIATPPSSGSRRERKVGESGSLAAWSREQLADIERQLMAIMGPVARVLVQDAAATTASRQELYRLLATYLKTPEERRRFLQAGDLGATNPGEPPLRTTNAILFGNIVGRPLTPEATQRATLLLARYVGPIAGLLTRKAAQTASDEAQLYSLLAEKVTDVRERERFLMEAGRQR
jgi:serine/threonine-protein kinase